MPSRPLRPCKHPGCPALVREGYCDKHKAQHEQSMHDYDKRRGTAAERGYDNRWRKYREQYLKAHPLCVECLKDNVYTPATVVDHIKPHKGNRTLFWDPKNHQPMCEHHHNVKTATEDGGYANKRKGTRGR